METYEGETVLWHGHPSWKSMLAFHVRWALFALVPIAVWIAARAAGHGGRLELYVVAALAVLVIGLALGWLRRATTRYTVTDRRIHIRTGLASRRDRATNVDRVQNVTISQGILARLLGIGDVEWDTAGTEERDADFVFRGVDDPTAVAGHADRIVHEAPGGASASSAPGL